LEWFLRRRQRCYSWGSASDAVSVGVPFAFDTWTLARSQSYRADGAIGGAQAGYNWQIQNYLLGVETDFQAAAQKGASGFSGVIIDTFVGFPDATAVSESAKPDWFGTLRARLGITSDRWLLYSTGGLAYGNVKTSGTAQPAPAAAGPTPPATWNGSETKAGWVLGAGVENALTANWSWKVEYLYMDLGRVSTSVGGGVNCLGSPGACTFTSGPFFGTVTTRFTDNILRGGLNYRF
jgi:outer membrane immunogenic protein